MLTSLAAVIPPVGIAPLLAAIPSLVDGLTAVSPANPEVGAGWDVRVEPVYSEEGDLEDEVDPGGYPGVQSEQKGPFFSRPPPLCNRSGKFSV